MSNSLQPQRNPTRLLCPWKFPGKYSGVGCHFLLQGIFLTQGIKPKSPELSGRFSTTELPGKPIIHLRFFYPKLISPILCFPAQDSQSSVESSYLWSKMIPISSQLLSLITFNTGREFVDNISEFLTLLNRMGSFF